MHTWLNMARNSSKSANRRNFRKFRNSLALDKRLVINSLKSFSSSSSNGGRKGGASICQSSHGDLYQCICIMVTPIVQSMVVTSRWNAVNEHIIRRSRWFSQILKMAKFKWFIQVSCLIWLNGEWVSCKASSTRLLKLMSSFSSFCVCVCVGVLCSCEWVGMCVGYLC